MIQNKDFISICLKNLKELDPLDILIFQSFKKDRAIKVQKISEQKFNVFEEGFFHKEFLDLSDKELKKTLKQLQKIEFPRSNQLWLKIVKNK
ncbi:hypothetical protein [Campylobacter aviculae]|uniref:Uncharacterized protein n=1 Tax=Campylobacter aviculae TaxID=2510190 RepID=A0A4U7BPR3_9BACT|nr:hypothetical protein [Campylobacter aviculae]TKX30916.1 hypothetical protein CQA76_07365 [Campylobacter aviculae]